MHACQQWKEVLSNKKNIVLNVCIFQQLVFQICFTLSLLLQPKHVYSEVKTTCVAHTLSDLCGNAHRSRILAEESMAEQQTAEASAFNHTLVCCLFPLFLFYRKSKIQNDCIYSSKKCEKPSQIMQHFKCLEKLHGYWIWGQTK